MVEWFKSAPKGSRHQRMLWTAQKIAQLTGDTEGGTYKGLLIALIEAEGRLDPWEFNGLPMKSDVIGEGANIDLFTEASIGLAFECLNVIA